MRYRMNKRRAARRRAGNPRPLWLSAICPLPAGVRNRRNIVGASALRVTASPPTVCEVAIAAVGLTGPVHVAPILTPV